MTRPISIALMLALDVLVIWMILSAFSAYSRGEQWMAVLFIFLATGNAHNAHRLWRQLRQSR